MQCPRLRHRLHVYWVGDLCVSLSKGMVEGTTSAGESFGSMLETERRNVMHHKTKVQSGTLLEEY